MPGELQVHDDTAAASRALAEAFVRGAAAAVERTGRFAVALTGGSSPRELYRLLGDAAFASRIPWGQVHLFWGDERCVPPGHPRSNFGMARSLLLSRVPVSGRNVHRIPGELGAERAAREYAADLRDFFGGEPPRFDLVHLGVGGDGHIASLFPFDRKRLLERRAAVATSLFRELGEARVTLTPPALNSSARVEMLLLGASKAAVASRVIERALDPLRIPAHLVRPASGGPVWVLSRDAARNLRKSGPD